MTLEIIEIKRIESPENVQMTQEIIPHQPKLKRNSEESIFCTTRKIGDQYLYIFYDMIFYMTKQTLVDRLYTTEELNQIMSIESHYHTQFFKNEEKMVGNEHGENVFSSTIHIYDMTGGESVCRTLKKYNTFIVHPQFGRGTFAQLLKPYKLEMKNNDEGSLVHYYGKNVFFFSRQYPSNMEFYKLFEDERLDRAWCLSEIDEIEKNSSYLPTKKKGFLYNLCLCIKRHW